MHLKNVTHFSSSLSTTSKPSTLSSPLPLGTPNNQPFVTLKHSVTPHFKDELPDAIDPVYSHNNRNDYNASEEFILEEHPHDEQHDIQRQNFQWFFVTQRPRTSETEEPEVHPTDARLNETGSGPDSKDSDMDFGDKLGKDFTEVTVRTSAGVPSLMPCVAIVASALLLAVTV